MARCEPYPSYDDLIEVIDAYSEEAQPVLRQLEHSAPQLTSSVNTPTPSHTKYSPQPTPIEQPEVPHPEEPDSIPMLEYDDSCPKTPCLVADDNITMCGRVKNFFIRCRGLLDIPLVLVFGILLYLVDVGSDVMAAVDHFEEGNPVWGSLTITFIVLPALCWAAVSWTWWYYDPQERKDRYKTHRMRRMRRMRMLLAVLLLDPLTR